MLFTSEIIRFYYEQNVIKYLIIMNKKIRLIHATGLTSIINVVAALKSEAIEIENKKDFYDVLLLDCSDQSLQVQVEIANYTYNFDDILTLDKNAPDFNAQITILINILRSKYPEIDEFWECYFYLEDIFYSYGFTLNYKNLYFYDEGIASYLSLVEYRRSKKIKEIKKAYFLNCDIFDHLNKLDVNMKQIEVAIYKKLISSLRNIIHLPQIKENSILFLSGHNTDLTNIELKIDCYTKVIHQLLKNDTKVTIYYKAHLREGKEYLTILSSKIRDISNFKILDFPYPAEILLTNKFKAIISYRSSILLHGYNIFKIPTFTFNFASLSKGRLLGKDHVDIQYGKYLINCYNPDICEYLDKNSKKTMEQYYLEQAQLNLLSESNKILSPINIIKFDQVIDNMEQLKAELNSQAIENSQVIDNMEQLKAELNSQAIENSQVIDNMEQLKAELNSHLYNIKKLEKKFLLRKIGNWFRRNKL
ncbi:hypothetical protein ABSA28_00208 [Candidatus Hepatincolaceae symbiont of Richtersius coronifer]